MLVSFVISHRNASYGEEHGYGSFTGYIKLSVSPQQLRPLGSSTIRFHRRSQNEMIWSVGTEECCGISLLRKAAVEEWLIDSASILSHNKIKKKKVSPILLLCLRRQLLGKCFKTQSVLSLTSSIIVCSFGSTFCKVVTSHYKHNCRHHYPLC